MLPHKLCIADDTRSQHVYPALIFVACSCRIWGVSAVQASTSQLRVTAAPEAMQTEIADTVDDHVWVPKGSTAVLAAEREARGEHLLDFIARQGLRDTAVKLCMLACGESFCLALHRCPSKAVQLYDDAEVRESIIRAFGEVSRSQFEALCAKAYADTDLEDLIRGIILPQDNIDEIYSKEAWVYQQLFLRMKELAEVMPWEYWAVSNGALLLEKSRQFTMKDRLVHNLTPAEWEDFENGCLQY
jgi:hypothetical protein